MAIELAPDEPAVYNNRGNSYRALCQHQRAIEDYNKAIDLAPGVARYFYNRGNSYESVGQHQRAKEDYDKAIDLDPNGAEAYTNRQTAVLAIESLTLDGDIGNTRIS